MKKIHSRLVIICFLLMFANHCANQGSRIYESPDMIAARTNNYTGSQYSTQMQNYYATQYPSQEAIQRCVQICYPQGMRSRINSQCPEQCVSVLQGSFRGVQSYLVSSMLGRGGSASGLTTPYRSTYFQNSSLLQDPMCGQNYAVNCPEMTMDYNYQLVVNALDDTAYYLEVNPNNASNVYCQRVLPGMYQLRNDRSLSGALSGLLRDTWENFQASALNWVQRRTNELFGGGRYSMGSECRDMRLYAQDLENQALLMRYSGSRGYDQRCLESDRGIPGYSMYCSN